MIFSRFPIQSFMITYFANSLITDSTVSATALASGFKTDNGMINVSPDLKVKYETIAEKAKKASYKVGILSSVMIDHATPAGFYAHQKNRNNYYEIALELPESKFDYFTKGGTSKPGKESDPKSVINKLHQNVYRYLTTGKK